MDLLRKLETTPIVRQMNSRIFPSSVNVVRCLVDFSVFALDYILNEASTLSPLQKSPSWCFKSLPAAA